MGITFRRRLSAVAAAAAAMTLAPFLPSASETAAPPAKSPEASAPSVAAKPGAGGETFAGTDGGRYPGGPPPFPETLEYLASEPVTLMDIGIQRMKHDLLMVGRQLRRRGIIPIPPITGAYFDLRQRKIIAYLTVREQYGDPRAGFCPELFVMVAKGLANRVQGQKSASWYLESLFSHEGWGNWGRPANLRGELMDLVHLEITLLPPDTFRGRPVNCKGRFDTAAEDIQVIASK